MYVLVAYVMQVTGVGYNNKGCVMHEDQEVTGYSNQSITRVVEVGFKQNPTITHKEQSFGVCGSVGSE